jgi:hypothetical protein
MSKIIKQNAYVRVCVRASFRQYKKKGKGEKKKENIIHAFVVRAGSEQEIKNIHTYAE